ncbi:hypothetical protein BpHYR1_052341 [Brachionus plicatilis]|uniref:Uncharacterized protein n=1 Tax=Brachionus plicatilis TaxID=10195 RepID=A0A3M7RZK8_BRAPC|nr:hypothetical protein BpHYR1_052341 [Brachionus plicatilis]
MSVFYKNRKFKKIFNKKLNSFSFTKEFNFKYENACLSNFRFLEKNGFLKSSVQKNRTKMQNGATFKVASNAIDLNL